MPRSSSRNLELLAQAELLVLPFLAPRVFQPFPSRSSPPRSRPRSNSETRSNRGLGTEPRSFSRPGVGSLGDHLCDRLQHNAFKKPLPLRYCYSGRRGIHNTAIEVDTIAYTTNGGPHTTTERKGVIHDLTLEEWNSVFAQVDTAQQRKSRPGDRVLLGIEELWDSIGKAASEDAESTKEFQSRSLEEHGELHHVVHVLKLLDTAKLDDYRATSWLQDAWNSNQQSYSRLQWLRSALILIKLSPWIGVQFCRAIKPDQTITNKQIDSILSLLARSAIEKPMTKTYVDEVAKLFAKWTSERGVFFRDHTLRNMITATIRSYQPRRTTLQIVFAALKAQPSIWLSLSTSMRLALAEALAVQVTRDICVETLASMLPEAVRNTKAVDTSHLFKSPKSIHERSVFFAILFQLFKELNMRWSPYERFLNQHGILLGAEALQEMAFQFAKNGRLNECLELLERAISEGFPSDSELVRNTCAMALNNADFSALGYIHAVRILKRILETGIQTDAALFNILAQKAIKAGDGDTAWRILAPLRSDEGIIQPTSHSYTLMLQAARLLKRKQGSSNARFLYNELQPDMEERLHPALIAEILRNILYFSSTGGRGWANVLAEYSKHYSMLPLIKLGLVDGGMDILESNLKLPEPDVRTFRLILRASMLNAKTYDRVWNVYRLFRGYAEAGYEPFVEYGSRSYIYADFIRVLMRTKQLSGARYSRVWRDILHDIGSPIPLPGSRGEVLPAILLDDYLALQIIRAYTSLREPHGAEWLIKTMKERDVTPNVSHYSYLILAWARRQHPVMIAKTLWRMEQQQLQPNTFIMDAIHRVLKDKATLTKLLGQVRRGGKPWLAEDKAHSKRIQDKVAAQRKRIAMPRYRVSSGESGGRKPQTQKA